MRYNLPANLDARGVLALRREILNRTVLTNPDDREKVRDMLASVFVRGGQEMQINCVDTATLPAAQEDPDRYRDLVVRMAGYSDFFTALSRNQQQDVIAREEHRV